MAESNYRVKQLSYKGITKNEESGEYKTLVLKNVNDKQVFGIKFGYNCETKGIGKKIIVYYIESINDKILNSDSEENLTPNQVEIQIGNTGVFELQPEIFTHYSNNWKKINKKQSNGSVIEEFYEPGDEIYTNINTYILGVKVPIDVDCMIDYVYDATVICDKGVNFN